MTGGKPRVCRVFRVRATGLLTAGTPRSTPPPRWRTGDCPPRAGSSSSWTRPAGAGTPGCGPSSLCSWRSGSRSSRRWPAPGRGGCRWWRCTAAPELEAGSPPQRRNPPFWWYSRRRPSRARSGTSGTPRLEGPSPRTPHPKCSPVGGKTQTRRVQWLCKSGNSGALSTASLAEPKRKWSFPLTSSSSISVTTLPGCGGRGKEMGHVMDNAWRCPSQNSTTVSNTGK